MSDTRMAIVGDEAAYAITARQRAKAVTGTYPTADDEFGYAAALRQCLEEKAADWKAACDSALAGTIEVGRLKAEIATLRITDAERDAVWSAIDDLDRASEKERAWPEMARILREQAATLRALLERHAKGGEE